MRNAAYDTILRGANLLALVERDAPVLQGKFACERSPEVPCPKCGGETRFRLRLCRDGIMRAFCSHCAPRGLDAFGYLMWRDGLDLKSAIAWWAGDSTLGAADFVRAKPEPAVPLDPAIAEAMHNGLGERAAYFRDRGIPDHLIRKHRLGWHAKWKRYAIPCIVDGQVWGIQCRIEPKLEKALKEAGRKHSKYLSVRGSHNKQLFNANVSGGRKLPFLFVVEGPMDALMMTGIGYPAVAAFQGNNRSRSWEPELWNQRMNAETVFVVPDNDEPGADGEISGLLFAQDKAEKIPRAVMKGIPRQHKDVGEMWKAGGSELVWNWFGLPPQKEFME